MRSQKATAVISFVAPSGMGSAVYLRMRRIYLDKKLLPLLLALLAGVHCARCGRRGDEHAESDHLLIDSEDELRPEADPPIDPDM